MMNLVDLLTAQLELQTGSMKDGDPRSLSPEQRAVFLTWNHTALIKELGEALDEVGWKPWATDRSLDHEKFMREMVDAFHFFMNMMLAASPDDSPSEIAEEFSQMYQAKHAVNAQRQADGYTGKAEKCPRCYRDLSETTCDPRIDYCITDLH